MASLIPWQDAGVDESPFVLVFNSIGLPFAGDVMNFVVLTAILSAANFRVVRLHTHAVVLGERRHDPTQHRQNQ